MRIITDSAADFTPEELDRFSVRCVPMQVIFGDESWSATSLSAEAFISAPLSRNVDIIHRYDYKRKLIFRIFHNSEIKTGHCRF